MAGLSNLYPPIIDTYMPAFIASSEGQGECRIYFSLSKYNIAEDIKSIWITINNQYTNESVINTSTGLKIFNRLNEDTTRAGDDRYYITITDGDIVNGWVLNQLYKVQIRFCMQAAPADLTMNWVVDNEGSFSEWSTVCLIQAISQPVLRLLNFEEVLAGNETIFTSQNNMIAGRVDFEDDEELESYELKIYNRSDIINPLFDSGIVYTNAYNPNEINYFLEYALLDGEQYLMRFTYTTKSLYSETQEFFFSVIDSGGEAINAQITAIQDEEEGRIKIHITSDTDRFFGNLTIRRASSETNFSIWEDVHTTSIISEDFLDFTWYDYTVESGIWYKYCVQKRNSYGDRGLIVQIKEPVMVTLQDMFLTRANQQLKIKFNPQVNSFKRTVSDSLTQTLGSKYPYIKRNGNVDYKQFSISGLISHFCDEQQIFMPEEELYKNRKDLYMEYNEKNRINEYNDFTLERSFRDKVQDFLYSNDVKLFRSPAEGNILVRLMDVSFSPEVTLGRMVYSFSATAYEIDEINFENYEKYGIQKVGTYSQYIARSYEKESQYQGILKGDLKTIIQNHEENTETKGLRKIIRHFNKIDLEIQSEPYLIGPDGTGRLKILTNTDTTNRDTILGYLIEINGRQVVIGPHGRYNASGEEIEITSVVFPTEVGMDVILNYNCTIDEGEDTRLLARQIYYTSRVGQLWGNYYPTQSITSTIEKKYESQNNSWYQRVFAINSVKIEAEPNTIFYLKDTSSSSYKRYMIGDTGYLNIEDSDFSIDGMYFTGSHLVLHNSDNEVIKDNEYQLCFDGTIYANPSEIKRPVKNGVYKVRSIASLTLSKENFDSSKNEYLLQLYEWMQPRETISYRGVYYVIYYKNNWCLFTSEMDAICPVQGIVDYYYELEKGEY